MYGIGIALQAAGDVPQTIPDGTHIQALALRVLLKSMLQGLGQLIVARFDIDQFMGQLPGMVTIVLGMQKIQEALPAKLAFFVIGSDGDERVLDLVL